MFHHPMLYVLPRLTDSNIQFGGNPHENVKRFVASIQEYKRDNNISDALALEDFEKILYGQALDWWRDNKRYFQRWHLALSGLINNYG